MYLLTTPITALSNEITCVPLGHLYYNCGWTAVFLVSLLLIYWLCYVNVFIQFRALFLHIVFCKNKNKNLQSKLNEYFISTLDAQWL